MDDRERLEQLRDQLTAAAENAKPADLPALARQLRDTLADLRALPDPTATDEVDELEQRRATQAKVPARPRGGRKRSATSG